MRPLHHEVLVRPIRKPRSKHVHLSADAKLCVTQHVVKTLPAPVKAAFQVAKAAVVMYKRMQLNQKARYATRHRKT